MQQQQELIKLLAQHFQHQLYRSFTVNGEQQHISQANYPNNESSSSSTATNLLEFASIVNQPSYSSTLNSSQSQHQQISNEMNLLRALGVKLTNNQLVSLHQQQQQQQQQQRSALIQAVAARQYESAAAACLNTAEQQQLKARMLSSAAKSNQDHHHHHQHHQEHQPQDQLRSLSNVSSKTKQDPQSSEMLKFSINTILGRNPSSNPRGDLTHELSASTTDHHHHHQHQNPQQMRSSEKPPHSYIGLIGMCILSSPEKRMLLSNIYDSILREYPYYRNRNSGWRNSVRHNLSLNECFQKSDRSPTGKGHYWTIHPANMDDFMRGDFRRRRAQRKVRRWNNMDVPSDESDDESIDVNKPPLPEYFKNAIEHHRRLEQAAYEKGSRSVHLASSTNTASAAAATATTASQQPAYNQSNGALNNLIGSQAGFLNHQPGSPLFMMDQQQQQQQQQQQTQQLHSDILINRLNL